MLIMLSLFYAFNADYVKFIFNAGRKQCHAYHLHWLFKQNIVTVICLIIQNRDMDFKSRHVFTNGLV